jgi:hypothetical protein
VWRLRLTQAVDYLRQDGWIKGSQQVNTVGSIMMEGTDDSIEPAPLLTVKANTFFQALCIIGFMMTSVMPLNLWFAFGVLAIQAQILGWWTWLISTMPYQAMLVLLLIQIACIPFLLPSFFRTLKDGCSLYSISPSGINDRGMCFVGVGLLKWEDIEQIRIRKTSFNFCEVLVYPRNIKAVLESKPWCIRPFVMANVLWNLVFSQAPLSLPLFWIEPGKGKVLATIAQYANVKGIAAVSKISEQREND